MARDANEVTLGAGVGDSIVTRGGDMAVAGGIAMVVVVVVIVVGTVGELELLGPTTRLVAGRGTGSAGG